MLSEKAKSRAQQRFFGMVRATQKGEMENPSPEITKVASSVSKSDVKKMASTKHKGLPEKKEIKEVWGAVAKVALSAGKGMIKQKAKQVVKQKAVNVAQGAIPQPNRDQQNEGVGRAAIGAGVGALVGGPVGAAAGAAIGASLGKKKVTGGNKVKKKATNFFKAEPKVTSSEGVVSFVKKGLERDKKAKKEKDIKNRKAVPYAALGASYQPEGELVDEKFATQYKDKSKLGQSSQRKSLGRGASIKDGAKASGYESKKEHRVVSKKLAPYQAKGTYNAHLNTEAKKFSELSTQRKPGEEKKPKKKREGYIFDKAQPPSKKVTNEEVGISSSAEMAKAQKEAKLKAKEDAAVAKKKKVTEAKVDTVKGLDDEGKEDARNYRKYGTKHSQHMQAVRRRSEHRSERSVKKIKGQKPAPKGAYGEDWKPEIEHSKLGDAKKKADKKRESKLPPHLQGDAIGKMRKAFASESKETAKLAKRIFKDQEPCAECGSVAHVTGQCPKKDHDVSEGVMDIVNRYKKKKEEKKPQKAQDAGARARRVLKRREYQSKVSAIVPAELEDHKVWDRIKRIW